MTVFRPAHLQWNPLILIAFNFPVKDLYFVEDWIFKALSVAPGTKFSFLC